MTVFDPLTDSAVRDGLTSAMTRSGQVERELTRDAARFRVLTGDRPTGPLHLGHYLGTLRNRVRLQDVGVEVFLVVADYQVITDRDSTAAIAGNVLELMADHLATGIDPAVTTIFAHSAVPALNQLVLPFLSLVTDAELCRNPTVKAELAATRSRGLSGLLLTYPVHQAADILFCGGNLVPVGRDQLPHLETTRLVARRFNERYGGGRAVFPEPDALLSEAPLLLGTDGAKMSKSSGNTIALRDSAEQTAALIRGARTDSERTITYEPMRRPEVASLLQIAALCSGSQPELIAEHISHGGAGELKRVVTESVNEHLRPLRHRRHELVANPGYLLDVLRVGNPRANEIAEHTLDEVRAVMGMKY